MSGSTELKQWREQNLVHKLLYDWILVPLGIIVILCFVFALHQIFQAIGFNFPANVAGMLIMSGVLILMETYLKESTMKAILKWIHPAIDFIMNWMIVLFFPPLITIINSTNLPNGADIIKLIIVFFVGLLLFIPLVGFFIHYVGLFVEKLKKSKKDSNETGPEEEVNEVIPKEKSDVKVDIHDDDNTNVNHDIDTDDDETAVHGSNIEEETKDITALPLDKNIEDTKNDSTSSDNENSNNNNNNNKNSSSETKKSSSKFQWKSSTTPSKYCYITYFTIFIFSWIPYLLWDITQPLHIATTVLAFFFSLTIPDRLRIVFHPLISCTVFCYFLFWVEGLILGHTLKEEIALYSNNSKYLQYLNDTSLPFPKAGEILFCLLDATVVALSFRILEHHKLIIRHIVELVGSIMVMSFSSMVVHTALCRLLAITPIYALSMTSRSSTNPLAVQEVNYLHSDMAIAILLVAFTGVFADILGLSWLKLLHFPLEDSLAHGACMGCAGHAMATAGLIKDFPSASAVSSISFVLFSTFCVVWSAITPIADLLRSIAGM